MVGRFRRAPSRNDGQLGVGSLRRHIEATAVDRARVSIERQPIAFCEGAVRDLADASIRIDAGPPRVKTWRRAARRIFSRLFVRKISPCLPCIPRRPAPRTLLSSAARAKARVAKNSGHPEACMVWEIVYCLSRARPFWPLSAFCPS